MRSPVTIALVVAPILLASVASAGFAIVQKDKQFSEETITVKSGETVHFVNSDSVAHNIVVKDPSGGSKPGIMQKPGEESDVLFDQAGEYDVRCLIHPKMKLSVNVN
jgi:plastocyanin